MLFIWNLSAQMKGWAVDINAAKDIINLGEVILKVLGSAIIIALLSHQLPEWAASTLASNVNMRFASQIISAANMVSGSSANSLPHNNIIRGSKQNG